MSEFKPRYSGPNRSGICVCGCSWQEHHLGVVMNEAYREATGESYVPEECEKFGFNEVGGKRLENGRWVDHCHRYRDMMETDG